MRALLRFLVLAACLPAAGAPAAHAKPKADVIKLLNGDFVTGEISQLQRGQLKYKTDHMGTVYVEWGEILRIQSPYEFRVRLREGGVITGRFMDSGIDRVVRIAGTDSLVVSADDVVDIYPIENSFWAGLDGSFSLGASYTKASEVGQLSLDFSSYYQTVRNRWRLLVSSITTTDKDDHPANNQDLSFALDRDLARETWFLGVSTGAQRNDELGLDLRLLFSATAGIRIAESNHDLLKVRSGLSMNREWSADSTEAKYNMEALVSADYSLFRYNSPKSDVTASLSVYPNLTDWGRVRMEIDVSGNYEVLADFFVSLSVYDSYDSEPPGQDQASNDYGIITSIGYSY